MFTKKESLAVFISVLLLSFVFGFDDGTNTFVLSNWLINILRIFLLVSVAILFRELVIKLFAKRHEAISEYKLWSVHQIWFNKKLSRGLPFGIFIALIGAVVSTGRLFFTAIGVHDLRENTNPRVGRKYQNLEYREEAQIISMGMLSNLFLAIVGLMIGHFFNLNMSVFVGINFYIVLFNMIPISELDGAKIFFGSLLTYAFLLVFLIAAFLLIKANIVLGLLIAFIVAAIAMFLVYYVWG